MIVGRAVNVLTPLRHIPVEIANAPGIGFLLANDVRLFGGIVGKPRALAQFVDGAKIVRAGGSGATRIFPLGFRRNR